MATILDVGLVQYFDIIFAMLLVFCLVYAVLIKTKALGEAKALPVTVAIVFAFMVLLSRNIVKMIQFMIPWFAIAIIFIVMVLLIFQIFGAGDKEIFAAMKKDSTIGWTIVGIAIVIFVAAGANVYGQKLVESGSSGDGTMVNETGTSTVAGGNFEQNIYATLFNPKVLGMLVLFAIAIFAVVLLSS